MGLRQWPLRGQPTMVFYSGGHESPTEDCKRLLRHIARWFERNPDKTIESVNVYTVHDPSDEPDPATWAATVVIGVEPNEDGERTTTLP